MDKTRWWKAILQALRWVIVGFMISVLADVYVIVSGFALKSGIVIVAVSSLAVLEYVILGHEEEIEDD